jgi:hypothetical protein
MNNNTFNEISTNESPTLSPSKNQKQNGSLDQKSHFINFSSFLTSLNIDSTKKCNISHKNLNIYYKEKEEKKVEKQKQKIKKRIIKKIIKKKSGTKHLLLDFDFILRELFDKNNLKKSVIVNEFREIVNRKKIRKKRKLAIKKSISALNDKENSKNFIIYI